MHQLRMSPFSPFCGWTSSLPDVFFFFTWRVFFFPPLLCPTYLPPPIPPPTSPVLPTTCLPPPTLNLPPLPTYHLRTPPPLTPSSELELWSCGVGAVELEQELERPPDPRPHDQVKCLFFILFSFVLFEEASKLQALELLWSFSASGLACCN